MKLGVVLDKYSGKNGSGNVNLVSDSQKQALCNKVPERVYKNLKASKDKKLI